MTTAVKKISIKTQAVGTVIALISAVALPQIIHVIGAVSGMGTSLGEALLPMHLPIILAGLLGGSYVAGIAGLLSPLLSFALTGMPTSAMLPFMCGEIPHTPDRSRKKHSGCQKSARTCIGYMPIF